MTMTALAQFRDEDLVDVSLESETVDGSVDDERRDEAAQRQGSDEGRGFPMSVRNADPQALARAERDRRRRAMLVEAQVSSMKIKRSGSRSSWPSNQSSRCFATSGRLCSEACAVFFCA